MPTHANTHAHTTTRAAKSSRRRRAARWAGIALATAAPVIGAGAVASPALANNHKPVSSYQFRTLDNSNDPTFNQLLGINQGGLIAGYFGSGAQGHPNQGYLLSVHHGQGRYLSENWPESAQTQVTGLNDRGVTVGFWSSANGADTATNDNRAFVSADGYFIDGDYPTSSPAAPPVDQLLGVNDRDVAVGFYNDASGNTHAYSFDIRHNAFNEITPAGIANPTASAINNRGDIAGFGTADGQVVGYVLSHDGSVITLSVPASSMTQALGINDSGEVVGVYQVGTGDSAVMHGFTWTAQGGFQTVDDPHGVGTTTVNGVNDQGEIVGFYTDSTGNTDGFVAKPSA